MSDKARANTEQMRAAGDDALEPVDSAPRLSPTSQRRRSLLRAAASSAPLVATLPSGAALAQASALQCVIQEQDGSKAKPIGAVNDPVPAEDTYMRVRGFLQVYLSLAEPAVGGAGIGFVNVYKYTVDGQTITIVGDNSDNTNAPGNVPDMGAWFATDVTPRPSLLNGSASQPEGAPTSFLLMYKANPNPITGPGDVSVDSNGMPTKCIINVPPWPGPSGNPASPSTPQSDDENSAQYCFYPIAVQADVNEAGNIPLTVSCIASFR